MFNNGDIVEPKRQFSSPFSSPYIYVVDTSTYLFQGVFLGLDNTSQTYSFYPSAYKLVTSILREEE